VKVHAAITDDDRAFIEARDMFFLATADADGRPNCSYKGGDPGFVRVVDPSGTVTLRPARGVRDADAGLEVSRGDPARPA
jgi:predicted pyridoxine 5'-phosphate oxidase superfamily flavin-nucleotide-binding protein